MHTWKPRQLEPEDVTRDGIKSVLSGEAADDEIMRGADQLDEAVSLKAAIEWMADDPDARLELATLITRYPHMCPSAAAILDKFVDLAVEDSGNWLARERGQRQRDYEEEVAAIEHSFDWKN